jgi:hypothetical protein
MIPTRQCRVFHPARLDISYLLATPGPVDKLSTDLPLGLSPPLRAGARGDWDDRDHERRACPLRAGARPVRVTFRDHSKFPFSRASARTRRYGTFTERAFPSGIDGTEEGREHMPVPGRDLALWQRRPTSRSRARISLTPMPDVHQTARVPHRQPGSDTSHGVTAGTEQQ